MKGPAPSRSREHDRLAPVPTTVITGFLGSGKTTLLNALLRHPNLSETAVLVNEFGEVGIDHLLVEALADDVVVLIAGCLCCTIRAAVVGCLASLWKRREARAIPEFRRVVIETTGLADPAPILHTLLSHETMHGRYRVDGIITTVDALHGSAQLAEHPESLKQVAVADRIVLTKEDLCTVASVTALRAEITSLNPGAPIVAATHGDIDAMQLVDVGPFDAGAKRPAVARWLNESAYQLAADSAHAAVTIHHDREIRAFCLSSGQPLDLY